MSQPVSLRQTDGIAYIEGACNQTAPRALLAAGVAAIAAGCTTIDLGAAGPLDSSAVSLMLAWQRRAQAGGQGLVFRGVPDSLKSLIHLYGVEDLIAI